MSFDCSTGIDSHDDTHHGVVVNGSNKRMNLRPRRVRIAVSEGDTWIGKRHPGDITDDTGTMERATNPDYRPSGAPSGYNRPSRAV